MSAAQIPEPTLTASQHHWLTHLHQQHASGLSMAAYAREHGLALTTFYNMGQKLRKLSAARSAVQMPLFQAVTIRPEPSPVPRCSLTLTFELPGRMTCEVRQLDVATCAALLRQLVEEAA